MLLQQLAYLHSATARRTRTGKTTQLRRREIHSFVRHSAGFVPPASLMVGMLEQVGCETTEATVEQDYETLKFTADLIAMHA
jgi:hypothetical protein